MYESVVRIIHDDLRIKQEESVMTVIQNLGIDVNKEELIKALQYDRDQYDKGYADGYEDAHEDIKKLPELIAECDRLKKENDMLWKKHNPVAVENERCPVCGTMVFVANRAYCRCCGQALKFEESHSPSVAYGDSSLPEGAISEDTEIGMIKNINDRT
ncbi:MAG: hypothetical protein IJB57_10895 [Clostridia bacterium]|nr:hypothetical protein [Clostridia bacterium]